MKKVLIPTKLESVAGEILKAHGGYEVIQDDKTDILEQARKHPDAYALIVRSEPIAAKVIDAFPGLKVIVRAGTGTDTIDIKHARKKGLDVMNTPGANSNAVAEEVVALMLADARHVIPGDQTTRAGRWEKKKFMGREITGKTVGIVGLGNIGQLVARRLSGFETKLLGYDPVISGERAASMNVELVKLPDLFARSDYVTLHIPENDKTRGIVNAELLSKMKTGATLINCARSGVVNEADLRRIKPEKRLRVLNDVYPEDKEGPKTIADVADIMLPHLGASTHEANAKAAQRAAEELIEFDDKGIASFIVNREIPQGLSETFCDLAYTITRLCHHLLGADVKLKTLETSFYGSLEPFKDWLLVPIVRALSEKFDSSMDFRSAPQFLKEMGVEVINRATDPGKGFENSITIDLTGSLDSDRLRKCSLRGTVAEGILMISRINEFDRLYFEPKGRAVFFLYEDRPGVLGQIGAALAATNTNIEDVRNPHNERVNQSLAIMKVNKPVPEAVMAKISESIKALAAFYYDFGG